MQKRALVVIPTETSAQAVIEASISLALTQQIDLEVVAMGYESTPVPLVDVGGLALAADLDYERERALVRAQAAITSFSAAAEAAGIKFRGRALCALPADAASIIADTARFFDFILVGQVDPGCDTFDKTLIEHLLLNAGRPVLFIPYTFRGAFKLDRVGICWDGSRAATRAVHDAMPFLAKATAIAVLTLNARNVLRCDSTSGELAAQFRDMGVDANIIALDVDASQVQSAILSLAADESLDLLVMGGYGHSRLKEHFLGGVTQDMLQSMTVPALMSH